MERRAGGRLPGIDVARAVAVLGMVLVHVGRFPAPLEGVATAYNATYGRAFVLFVLLAGVGVALLAGDRSPARLRRLAVTVAVRVVVFVPLGIWLQGLDTGVAVILHYYALYFVLAGALVLLPDRVLAAVPAVMVVVGPLVLLAAAAAFPEPFRQGRFIELGDPAVIARDLVLTGYYPLVTAVVPLALGLWIGRRDLRAAATRRALVAGGIAAAAVAHTAGWVLRGVFGTPPADALALGPAPGGGIAWTTLLDTGGHSEMPLSIIGATAIGCAVLGLALVVADRLPRATWPLAAVGRMALSVYVGHLLVLHWFPGWLIGDDPLEALGRVARFLVVTAALASAWFAVLPRGPLETLLHLPVQALPRPLPRTGAGTAPGAGDRS